MAPKGTIIEQAAQAATLIVTKDALNTGQAGKQLQDLQRVRCAWEECQSNRSRDAIYRYLGAVYALVSWWSRHQRSAVAGHGNCHRLRICAQVAILGRA